MTLRLFAVVRAGHPLPPGDARLVSRADLAVVAATHPPPGPLTEDDAASHLGLVSQLVRRGPVLPLRFGTIAPDEPAIRDGVLGPDAPRLRAHLNRLDGFAEVHIHLRFDESAALRAIHYTGAPAPAAALDLRHTIAFGRTIAERLTTWRRERARILLAPVSALAHSSAPLPERADIEERQAFLIPLDRLDHIRAAVATITLEPDVHAECVGPLPAYSFLEAHTEPSWETPSQPASRWGW